MHLALADHAEVGGAVDKIHCVRVIFAWPVSSIHTAPSQQANHAAKPVRPSHQSKLKQTGWGGLKELCPIDWRRSGLYIAATAATKPRASAETVGT